MLLSLTMLRRLYRLPGAGGLPGAGTPEQANVVQWQRDHDGYFRRSRNLKSQLHTTKL